MESTWPVLLWSLPEFCGRRRTEQGWAQGGGLGPHSQSGPGWSQGQAEQKSLWPNTSAVLPTLLLRLETPVHELRECWAGDPGLSSLGPTRAVGVFGTSWVLNHTARQAYADEAYGPEGGPGEDRCQCRAFCGWPLLGMPTDCALGQASGQFTRKV